jgi:hypothetical protein
MMATQSMVTAAILSVYLSQGPAVMARSTLGKFATTGLPTTVEPATPTAPLSAWDRPVVMVQPVLKPSFATTGLSMTVAHVMQPALRQERGRPVVMASFVPRWSFAMMVFSTPAVVAMPVV